MPTPPTITITNAGRAAIVNLPHTGTAAVTIAAVGFTATAIAPVPTMIALPDEIKRVSTISGDVVAPDVIHLTVRDESADSYSVRGLGLYLADGTLFGVFGQPTVLIEKSTQSMLLLSANVGLVDIAAATIAFGDTSFLLPPATTERQGLVELADGAEADAGVDDVRAVTPKRMKTSVTKWLDTRLGAGAPSTFMKSLLPTASVVALRLALGLKSAALKDEGHGNLLDADKLDGQEGSWYADIIARLGFSPLPAASYTAADVRTKLLTVDGAGSGVDSDLLDGQQGAYYLDAGNLTGTIAAARLSGTYAISISGSAATLATARNIGLTGDATGLIAFNGAGNVNIPVTLSASAVLEKLVTVDGAGSGVDSDLLDGQHGSYYANIPARLGFSPVQQGTGVGQLPNLVKIGWSAGNRLKATVDATDQGNFVFDSHIADVVRSSHYTSGGNANGYWRKTPDGIIEQWGICATVAGEGPVVQNFPIPFTELASVNIQITIIGQGGTGNDMFVQRYTKTLAGFQAFYQSQTSGNTGYGFEWRAIGR